MVFCKDCKHYNDFGGLCVRGETVVGHNPVTGNEELKYETLRSAEEERGSFWPWHCGKAGRRFVRSNAEVSGAGTASAGLPG